MKIGKTTPTKIRTFMVLGGITLQEGGWWDKKSYKGWSKGPCIKFFEVQVRLSKLSYEETVHMFSLNK